MTKAKKFGVFGGVFTPSILTILGVIMYLRLPWIVGQAGFFATLGIIIVAHIISASTGLSVASIATDKKVESGGTYYIISRSLGLPIGGTLGWALFVGLSFSVSLYLIGFSEVLLNTIGVEASLNNIRIAGIISLLSVTILTFISTSLAIKSQYLIMAAIVLSLLSVIFGTHSYAPAALQTDTLPDSLPWIALFAIFFPAVTGFEAGVSMSGDLKDPKRAIPFGTIAAIVVGLITYICLTYYFSATVDREKLVNDPKVLLNISLIPQLVVVGILGATFSSALGSILSAPRILQAVAKDRIAPRFFSKGYGPSNEPRNAILLTFLIALGGILIGELNVIARVVTTFFIITYGFLNITYTVESWASSDFRPTFRIPRFISIIGAIASIVVMIQLDVLAMIAATIILLLLFLVLRRQELNLQSGDTWTSVWMSVVKLGLKKLTRNELHTRNWKPNVILFSGGAATRPHLVEMGLALTGHQGVFTNFELEEDPELVSGVSERVRVEKLKDFPEIITRKYRFSSIYEGIDMISRVYGFSGFEPDTILMGWPRKTAHPDQMNRLLKSLQKRNFNLALLDYDQGSGFGTYSSIDFWWKGSGRELTLALHFLRFITARREWRKARLRILVANEDPLLTEKYKRVLTQMLDDYRLNAEVKVISTTEQKPVSSLLPEESGSTDLTLLALPSPNEPEGEQFIEQLDQLSARLHSCLWICASGRFESVEVHPVTYTRIVDPDDAKVTTLSSDLQENIAGKDDQDLLEFAHQSDTLLSTLHQELFVVLEEQRIARIEAFASQKKDVAAWMDLLNQYQQEELLAEKELLHRGINHFITSLKTNIENLLKQMLIKPGRNDLKALEIAVRYHLYARRIDSIEQFYTDFLERSVLYNTGIHQLLVRLQQSTSEAELQDSWKQLRHQTLTQLNELYQLLVTSLQKDIVLLSQLIESQKYNDVAAGFKKLLHQKLQKESALDEMPERWYRFMQLQWNRTKLEGISLQAKATILSANQRLADSLHALLQQSLYDALNDIIAQCSEPNVLKQVGMPSVDWSLIDQLLNEYKDQLKNSVQQVPETIADSGHSLSETLTIQSIEYVSEVEAPVREVMNYYITNEILEKADRQSQHFIRGIQRVTLALGNIAKLVAYHQSIQGASTAPESQLLADLKVNATRELSRMQEFEAAFVETLEAGTQQAFESLGSTEILHSATHMFSRRMLHQKQRSSRRKMLALLSAYRERFVHALVTLIYHQSKGVLWTRRQELLRERRVLNLGDVLKNYAVTHHPNPVILHQLPYYYVNLFTDDAGTSPEFRVHMQEETERGHRAVKRFMDGNPGIIVVTGDRGSGKSSLARFLVNHHFKQDSIWRLRPPVECSADLNEFDRQLKELAGGKGSLERRLDALSDKKAVVIDELEVWWERRPNGTRVVERMLELVRLYGSHLLFVVTINRHALRVLNQLTPLNAWLNELIFCQPLDSKELKEMILTRHQSGGLSFVLEGQEEEEMTNRAYARFFNQLFNCTRGNPGEAVNLWLSAIQSVEGTRIVLEMPVQEEPDANGSLSDREWMIILQFVIHRRFSPEALARSLDISIHTLAFSIRLLQRNGVLMESGTGIYSLSPAMEPVVIANLKKMSCL